MAAPTYHADTLRQFEADVEFIKPENLYRESALLLEERKRCLAHDEEVTCPALPAVIADRLHHGRQLALARAEDIFNVVAHAVNSHPLDKIPAELVDWHKDHKPQTAPKHSKLWDTFMGDLSDR